MQHHCPELSPNRKYSQVQNGKSANRKTSLLQRGIEKTSRRAGKNAIGRHFEVWERVSLKFRARRNSDLMVEIENHERTKPAMRRMTLYRFQLAFGGGRCDFCRRSHSEYRQLSEGDRMLYQRLKWKV